MPHDILLLRGDTSTGVISLSDGGTTVVYSGSTDRSVSWRIRDTRIASFRLVGKQLSDPFGNRPRVSYSTTENLTVRSGTPRSDWNYTIWWKRVGSNKEYQYDPKIAIKPGVELAPAMYFIAAAVISIALILYRIFIVRKRRRIAANPEREHTRR